MLTHNLAPRPSRVRTTFCYSSDVLRCSHRIPTMVKCQAFIINQVNLTLLMSSFPVTDDDWRLIVPTSVKPKLHFVEIDARNVTCPQTMQEAQSKDANVPRASVLVFLISKHMVDELMDQWSGNGFSFLDRQLQHLISQPTHKKAKTSFAGSHVVVQSTYVIHALFSRITSQSRDFLANWCILATVFCESSVIHASTYIGFHGRIASSMPRAVCRKAAKCSTWLLYTCLVFSDLESIWMSEAAMSWSMVVVHRHVFQTFWECHTYIYIMAVFTRIELFDLYPILKFTARLGFR